MFQPKHFEDLAKQLFEALPLDLQNIENGLQQKFHTILQATFANLDLVTREEFDVQLKVLYRTREKVEALQQQINSLLASRES